MKEKKVVLSILLSSVILGVLSLHFASASFSLLDSTNDNEIVQGTPHKLAKIVLTDSSDAYFLYKIVKEGAPAEATQYSRLCGPCNSKKTYVKKFNLIEGNYKLITLDGNNQSNEILFTIDDKKPKIKDFSPSNNKNFGTGEFSVTVADNHLDKVVLSIRKATGTQWDAEREMTCDAEQKCIYDISGEGYQTGDQVYYYFKVVDKAGNMQETKPNKITLDFASPTINVISPDFSSPIEGRVILTVGTDELSEILYKTDLESDYGRKLCSSCTFTKKILILPEGSHTLEILATDRAGNQRTETYSIEVEDC